MPSTLLVANAVASGLAIGFVPALVDRVRAPLQQRIPRLSDRAGRILSVFYLCWLPAMPLCGWLLDRGWAKEVLFFGLLGCVLGIAWLGLSQNAGSLLSSVLVLGVSYAGAATAGIRLMADAMKFTPESSQVGALNVGFVFVVIGAVAGPWLFGRFERRWGHRQALLYLSLTLVVAAALAVLAPAAPARESSAATTLSAVMSDVRLWLLGAVILLYFALENCLDVWPEPYLLELGYRGRALAVAMLVFWSVFTALRVVMGWLPQTGVETWILLGLTLASGFAMGNLVGANESNSGSVGFWITGACYGPLLPGFLALVLEMFPDLSGTALGLMLALGGLDTLIVRPLMTRLARRHPARIVMRVPTILALVMAAPLLVLALIHR